MGFLYKPVYNEERRGNYDSTVFDKDAKTIEWESTGFSNRWYWKNRILTCKRMKLDLHLTLNTKINSKEIKALNVKGRSIKLVDENIGQSFMMLDFAVISHI